MLNGQVLPKVAEGEFDPVKYDAFKRKVERREAISSASLIALLPPAFLLIFGSGLVWAFRGFRR
jgi:hypothetical protein